MAYCGQEHTICLGDDGVLFAFGCAAKGALGLKVLSTKLWLPVNLPLPTKITHVACGIYHTACIGEQGELWTFGNNDYGQLGIGESVDQMERLPCRVANLPPIRSVQCGFHTMCITYDNSVWGFGRNDKGQLGLGHQQAQWVPKQITLDNIAKISCGGYHTLLITQDGRLLACGDNRFGQLGVSKDTAFIASAIQVPNTPIAFSISCGWFHSSLIDENGNLYTCGKNQYGQLGIGKCSLFVELFTKVNDLPPVVDVSCGGNHSACIDEKRFLWTFGQNFMGQLGLQDDKNREKPCRVPNLSSVLSLSHGPAADHVLVKDWSGSIYAFGENYLGQLGIGNYTDQWVPTTLKEEYSQIIAINFSSKAKSARK